MKQYLIIKVWIIHLLQRLKILSNVWYASEIKLAKIKGRELADLVKADNESEDNEQSTTCCANPHIVWNHDKIKWKCVSCATKGNKI